MLSVNNSGKNIIYVTNNVNNNILNYKKKLNHAINRFRVLILFLIYAIHVY